MNTIRYTVNRLGMNYYAVRDLRTELDVATTTDRAEAESLAAQGNAHQATHIIPVDPATESLLRARDEGCVMLGPTGRRVLHQPREEGDPEPWVAVMSTVRYRSTEITAKGPMVDVITDTADLA